MQNGYEYDMKRHPHLRYRPHFPNPRPLTHRQIEVFRTVMATAMSPARLDRLGSSQPTISRDLARLEQVLSTALFDACAADCDRRHQHRRCSPR